MINIINHDIFGTCSVFDPKCITKTTSSDDLVTFYYIVPEELLKCLGLVIKQNMLLTV